MIIDLFEQFGIQNKMAKLVAMVCQPGSISGRKSTAAYGRQMSIEGDSHHVWQHRRLVCEECGVELAAEYI